MASPYTIVFVLLAAIHFGKICPGLAMGHSNPTVSGREGVPLLNLLAKILLLNILEF